MTAVSIVVGVYNMREYLPRFIQSLREQTLTDFEALFIDDASTDDSAAMLEAAVSGDRRFTLLRQAQNSGVGAARNRGIRSACGETICFADPDDLLPPESLEVRYAAFKKYNALVRACHQEIASDGRVLHHETRPSLPEVCLPREEAKRISVSPFLCAHWTWLFPTKLLRRHNIFYGENMSTADDILMLAKLFFHIPRLVWLPDVVYCWMKRPDSLSSTRYSNEHYADYVNCIDVFYEEARKNRAIDLGDRFCSDYIGTYLKHCARQCLSGQGTEQDARRLVALAAEICAKHKTFARFSGETGEAVRYTGLFLLRHALDDGSPFMIQRLVNAVTMLEGEIRAAGYAAIRQSGREVPVGFDKYDARQGLLRARYLFCDAPPVERFTQAARPLKAAFVKNRLEYQGNSFSVFERVLWLPVSGGGDGVFEFSLDGQESGLKNTSAEIRRAFAPAPPEESALPAEARVLRKFVQSPAAGRFKHAWLFMDRDTQADDNAEHLYRWVMRHRPEINAWFALAEASLDWPRLKAEGFKLVPFGSMEHKALFILCSNLISSQMDRYIYALLEHEYYADLRETKFICLDHGVIKEDMSSWLNTVEMDLFVTTTEGERRSIAGDGTPYALTEKEVIRSGLPRHDSLLEASQAEKNIFIMPTWRCSLTGAWDGAGQRREHNPAFMDSRFARTWKSLLTSAVLEKLCREYGYAPVFWPHPGFHDYLPDFNLPAHIRIPAGESIQTMLKKSALLITDFSSIVFDMALLRRPALYYHFESHDCYLEAQGRRNSYFQYDRDGFGPVCYTEEELLAALERVLAAGCRPEPAYLERMEQTLDLNDGQCCRRTFEAILAASKPFFCRNDESL